MEKRANIIGLSESRNAYIQQAPEGISIGVNDIFKHFRVDYVVCADKPETFTPERRRVIENCDPESFFSHLETWERFHQQRFVKLNLTGRMDAKLFSNWESLPRGIDSTYIAACVAYHLGAKQIVLYGADFIGHPHLGRSEKIAQIKKHYAELARAMATKKVQLQLGVRSGALVDILPLSQ